MNFSPINRPQMTKKEEMNMAKQFLIDMAANDIPHEPTKAIALLGISLCMAGGILSFIGVLIFGFAYNLAK